MTEKATIRVIVRQILDCGAIEISNAAKIFKVLRKNCNAPWYIRPNGSADIQDAELGDGMRMVIGDVSAPGPHDITFEGGVWVDADKSLKYYCEDDSRTLCPTSLLSAAGGSK